MAKAMKYKEKELAKQQEEERTELLKRIEERGPDHEACPPISKMYADAMPP